MAGFNQMASRLGSVEGTRRRLLADLGHEMRTPVATLEAGLEALEDGVATLDAGTAELLHSQTRRLSRLSEDITSVSQAEEGQVRLDRRQVELESLVSASVDSVAEAYGTKGVLLVTGIAPRLPRLLLDPERMGQVLGNLLDNALRHTPAGGSVTISASLSPGTGDAELSVADTGEGIPAEHLPHVFERFYRVDTAVIGLTEDPASGWPSPRPWSRPTAGSSPQPAPGPGRGLRSVSPCPAPEQHGRSSLLPVLAVSADRGQPCGLPTPPVHSPPGSGACVPDLNVLTKLFNLGSLAESSSS